MKYMPIPVLTPWYVYKSSHEYVFIIIFAKNLTLECIGNIKYYFCNSQENLKDSNNME